MVSENGRNDRGWEWNGHSVAIGTYSPAPKSLLRTRTYLQSSTQLQLPSTDKSLQLVRVSDFTTPFLHPLYAPTHIGRIYTSSSTPTPYFGFFANKLKISVRRLFTAEAMNFRGSLRRHIVSCSPHRHIVSRSLRRHIVSRSPHRQKCIAQCTSESPQTYCIVQTKINLQASR